jgi:PhnB protein
MAAKPDPIPAGYPGVTPYLCVKDAAKMIEFYKRAFGAIETGRLLGPDGRIGHAEIKIGGGPVMLADEHPEIGVLSPKSLGDSRSPVGLHLYVEDVDAVYQRALAAGATSVREPADQFYGDRNAQVNDPSGHVWYISTRKEDLSMEEMQRRMTQLRK